MGFFMMLICFFILFTLSWPLAIALLLFWPLFWLITIPFRIIGLIFSALIALIAAILFLPARILGAGR